MKPGTERTERMIDDILATNGEDPIDLAKKYKLKPAELAAWVGQESVQSILTGMCVLADLQTQVMLTRYRRTAAAQLIELAAPRRVEGKPPADPDLTRKACVDLLRLELKRAEGNPAAPTDPAAPATLDQLRGLIYTKAEK